MKYTNMQTSNIDHGYTLWMVFDAGLGLYVWTLLLHDVTLSASGVKLFYFIWSKMWLVNKIMPSSVDNILYLKVSDMIHNIIPPPQIFFKPTVILVPNVKSYFSDFCCAIWCEYSKYFRRNQQKCCLEIRKHGHYTK